MSSGPDFIVVGAPKCGTTSLHSYLEQSPHVFVPRKEVHYFGSDVQVRYPPMGRDGYESLFASADGRVAGEVGIWYLYSASAAEEIKRYNSDMRIVIMLRNPIDQMYAHHSQALWAGNEDEPDFRRALALGATRREHEQKLRSRLPDSKILRYRDIQLQYRDISDYPQQIERYLDMFGRERVHVIVLEEMAMNHAAMWTELCEFLGCPATPAPDFAVSNLNARNRSNAMARALAIVPRRAIPALRLGAAPRWMKEPLIRAYNATHRLNTATEQRHALSPAFRSELLAETEPTVNRVEAILGRGLPTWRV